MVDLVFELLNPALLKPDLRNARTHPKKQIAQIAASIAASVRWRPVADGASKSWRTSRGMRGTISACF